MLRGIRLLSAPILLSAATAAAFASPSLSRCLPLRCLFQLRNPLRAQGGTRSHPKAMAFQLPKPEDTDHPLQTGPKAAGLRWSPNAAAGPISVILGSKSATRNLLLSCLGVEYKVVTPDIDEKAIRFDSPEKLVLALAHAKADALLQRDEVKEEVGKGATLLLVTCDQVVVHEGKILEKPESREEAERFIKGYGRAPCSTVGGIVVTNLATGSRSEALDRASIHFREIPDQVAQGLIDAGDVFYCAGGLMVEAPEIQPYLVKIEGSMDSVMGLGRSVTADLLTKALES